MRRVLDRNHERGVVLVVALLLMVAGTLVGMAAMTISDIEMLRSGNQRSLQQLFDAAEAGIDVGINQFFVDAPPWGAVRPPFTDPPSKVPWGIVTMDSLPNGCGYSVWIEDMQVSGRPPPGNDPNKWRTHYYRIRSNGCEQGSGPNPPQGVRETEQVVGVVYMR